jgi:hypothetical protein
MARKLSLNDRLERFNNGCCPIHGTFMSQIDAWYRDEFGKEFTIVRCPRKNCDARAMAYSFDGPWKILKDCSYLLEENLDMSRLPPLTKPSFVPKEQRASRQKILSKTNGHCMYCGIKLSSPENFSIDHVVARVSGGENTVENLVPCCRSCNSAKRTKDLDEFRGYRAMQEFQKLYGVSFSQDQIRFLESIGVVLDIPEHLFWFEEQGFDPLL